MIEILTDNQIIRAQHNARNPKRSLSRRDFLKLSVAAAETLTLTSLELGLSGCLGKPDQQSGDFDFVEIKPGVKINFRDQSGNPIPLVIQYTDSRNKLVSGGTKMFEMDRVTMRCSPDGTPLYLPMENGASTRRTIPEITDYTLYKILRKSPDLPEYISVGMYTTAGGMYDTSASRTDLPTNGQLVGIKVATGWADYMQKENPGIVENNIRPKNSGNAFPRQFGQGMLVGKLMDNGTTFKAMGYVLDARALQIEPTMVVGK